MLATPLLLLALLAELFANLQTHSDQFGRDDGRRWTGAKDKQHQMTAALKFQLNIKEMEMDSKFKQLKCHQAIKPITIEDAFDVAAGCSASCGTQSCPSSCGATCNATCVTSSTTTKPVIQ